MIFFFKSGWSVCLFIWEKVGVIIKNVKNSDKLINIWLGGICCVLSDVCINDSIMIICVK